MVTTNMKKFLGSIKRNSTAVRSKSKDDPSRNAGQPMSLPQGDHPEAVAVREAVAFCEAGAPGSTTAGDEYLHLPAIVDAAESSPAAAHEVAVTVQRYLSKQNNERGYAQYNALMLARILTDNPGRNFTQNFDKQFISTIKSLLRENRDASVQQICRETLDYFEVEKLPDNDSLTPLIEMWRKEKGSGARMYSSSGANYGPQGGRPRVQRRPTGLPPADELAARIEEAKTSARLLVQMVQSTPQNELQNNDLIKEFAERARQAHKTTQQYMACENPAPDEQTMLTLIETSEQLNIAMTKHSRAILQARKAASNNTTPQNQQPDPFSTTAMQNSLPPQPARPVAQNQYQDYSTPYGQHARQESEDLYKNASVTNSAVSPQANSYLPPSGPPPARQTHDAGYPSQHEPVSPPRTHERPDSASQSYGVGDNPFADDNAYTAPSGPPPQQQNSYSVFNRAADQMRADNKRNTADLDQNAYPTPSSTANANETSPQRPGAPSSYNNPGWQPTPSFMHRQDSSLAHINMSGASPPPDR